MGITQNMVHDTKTMVVIVLVTIVVCDGDNCGDIQPIIKTTKNEMTNKAKTYIKKAISCSIQTFNGKANHDR